MNADWQSIAAIAVVAATLVIFAVKIGIRMKKFSDPNSKGCGGSCGCPSKPKLGK